MIALSVSEISALYLVFVTSRFLGIVGRYQQCSGAICETCASNGLPVECLPQYGKINMIIQKVHGVAAKKRGSVHHHLTPE